MFAGLFAKIVCLKFPARIVVVVAQFGIALGCLALNPPQDMMYSSRFDRSAKQYDSDRSGSYQLLTSFRFNYARSKE